MNFLKPILVIIFLYLVLTALKSLVHASAYLTIFLPLILSIILILVSSKGNLKIYGFKKVRFKAFINPILIILIYSFVISLIQYYAKIHRGSSSMEAQPVLLLILVLFFIGPITEELLFRGYLQTGLNDLKQKGVYLFNLFFSVPVIIGALLFALFHLFNIQNNNYIFVLFTVMDCFFFGLISGYYREKTESIYPSIVIHSLANILSPFFLFAITQANL
jgi:membrane protease YdiL (CAAX protease family)